MRGIMLYLPLFRQGSQSQEGTDKAFVLYKCRREGVLDTEREREREREREFSLKKKKKKNQNWSEMILQSSK